MPRKSKTVEETMEVKEVKKRVRKNIISEYGVYAVYMENESTGELIKTKTFGISEYDAEQRVDLIVNDVNFDHLKTVYIGALKIPTDVISNALSLEENLSDIERGAITEVLRKAGLLLEVL